MKDSKIIRTCKGCLFYTVTAINYTSTITNKQRRFEQIRGKYVSVGNYKPRISNMEDISIEKCNPLKSVSDRFGYAVGH